MALDVGDRKIGVAITDPLAIMATPLTTLRFKDENEKISKSAALANENQVSQIVIGMPKNLKGAEDVQANKTKAFAENLSKFTKAEIIFVDERLTTKKALNDLGYLSIKKIKEKDILDMQAAVNILETYLSMRKF